jgi:hypothetical protein
VSDDRLHRAVSDHYRGKQLRSEVMTRLLAQVADEATEVEPSEREEPATHAPPRRRDWLAMTAMAAAAAALMLAGGNRMVSLDDTGARDRTVVVAEEIALNHNKQLAVEFPAPTYPALANHMAKLDFTPARPAHGQTDAELLGGRYCSIQKSIAAQIKLVDDSGGVHTLYETRWNDEFDGLPGNTVDVDGVRVKFWRESDVLFGLATTSR